MEPPGFTINLTQGSRGATHPVATGSRCLFVCVLFCLLDVLKGSLFNH